MAAARSSGARHLEGPVEGPAGAVGQVVDERDVADLDQVDLDWRLVGEDPAEQHQEHQREDDREEHRRPVAPEPLADRDGEAPEGAAPAHARYSRPVRSRNTSSRVAVRTEMPSSRRSSASRVSTAAGSVVSIGLAVGGGDPGRRREAGDQRGRGVELQHPAVVHDRDPVAQRLGLVEVVGGQDDGAAAVVEARRAGPTGCDAPAGRATRSARRGRPPRGRGPGRTRSRAAASARRRAARPGCRPCRPCPTRSSHASAAAARDVVERGEGVQLLAGGQPLEERRGLELHPDPRQQRPVARPRRLPEHADRPGVRLAEPLDHLERRRLAGPVGAEDAEELTLGHLEAHAVDSPELPVRLRQVADLDRCHGLTLSSTESGWFNRLWSLPRRPSATARPAPAGPRARAAAPRRRSGPTSCTDSGRPSGPRPRGTAAAGLPATFQIAAYAIAGRARSEAPTVPVPAITPVSGGRWAIVGRQQHVDVVEDPVGARRHPLGGPERGVAHPRRHPRPHPAGLPGAGLEPVVVLDLVGLAADPGEELRHERGRRVGVARVDLAHVVAEVGQQPGGVADRRDVQRVGSYAADGRPGAPPDPQPSRLAGGGGHERPGRSRPGRGRPRRCRAPRRRPGRCRARCG